MQRRMNKHFIVDWENWSSNERRWKKKGMILGRGEREMRQLVVGG